MPVGRRIRILRLSLGRSQRALAREASLSGASLSRIEAGEQDPGFETVVSLSRALECSLEALADDALVTRIVEARMGAFGGLDRDPGVRLGPHSLSIGVVAVERLRREASIRRGIGLPIEVLCVPSDEWPDARVVRPTDSPPDLSGPGLVVARTDMLLWPLLGPPLRSLLRHGRAGRVSVALYSPPRPSAPRLALANCSRIVYDHGDGLRLRTASMGSSAEPTLAVEGLRRSSTRR